MSAYDFYVEGPRRLEAIEAINRATLSATRSGGAGVIAALDRNSLHLSDAIAAQLQEQTKSITDAFSSAAAEVSDAVRQGAVAICDGLREISWGIAQVNEALDRLIYIQSNRRRIEARELLAQALRHLRAENYEFADQRLRAAFELDNTEYCTLYNLGVTALFRDKIEEAVKYFKLCARVPDDITQEAKVRALFSLARAQMISGDKSGAVKTMREAHTLEETARNKYYLGTYLLSAGQGAEGLKYLTAAILQDEHIFAIAAVSVDLGDYARLVVPLLEGLDTKAVERFQSALKKDNVLRSGVVGEHGGRFVDSLPSRLLSLGRRHAIQAHQGSYSSKIRFARIIDGLVSAESLCGRELSINRDLESIDGIRAACAVGHDDARRQKQSQLNILDHGWYFTMAAGVAIGCIIAHLLGHRVTASDSSLFLLIGSSILFGIFWPLSVFAIIAISVNDPAFVSFMWFPVFGAIIPLLYTVLHRMIVRDVNTANRVEIREKGDALKNIESRVAVLKSNLNATRAEMTGLLTPIFTGNE